MAVDANITLTTSTVMNMHHPFVISDDFLAAFATIADAGVNLVICTFGVFTNIINITIFTKNGLKDTVNISLLALSISDLICLVSLIWISITLNPLFVSSDIPWVMIDVVYLTGGCTHAIFARTTSWVTAFVSLERCLCVLMPLHIKQIITSALTKAAMLVIYVLMIFTHLPVYISLYLGWKFDEKYNRTLVGILPRQNIDKVESLSFIFAISSQLVSFLAVIILTVILILQIRQHLKWRNSVTSEVGLSNKNQKRSDRTVKIVLVVAITYIVCFFPSIFVYICSLIVPELSITGQYRNAFRVAWTTAFTFEALNSSSNFCVYYVMNSKFRKMCHKTNPFRKQKSSIKEKA